MKAPLGLPPKWLHDENRLNEIILAIGRYMEASCELPQEWIDEYNSICKTINEMRSIK